MAFVATSQARQMQANRELANREKNENENRFATLFIFHLIFHILFYSIRSWNRVVEQISEIVVCHNINRFAKRCVVGVSSAIQRKIVDVLDNSEARMRCTRFDDK